MTTQNPTIFPSSLQKLAYLNLKAVQGLTGLSHTTIYKMMRAGRFPKSYELGPQKRAWRYGDIEDWLLSCPRSNAGAE
jgi:prophage regulatory protein